ncbi:MAG: T9SS type A sorting domain-containing protein [Candidatus Kapaibacterium sp.]
MRWCLLYTFLFLYVLYSCNAQGTYDDLVYGKGSFFGNANNDAYLLGVTVDSKGNIYGTGLCTSIPATKGAYNENNNGQYDIMVFKLDPTMSTLIWATYIGGSGNDGGGSIAVDDKGNVFVSGYTYSKNFPITDGNDAQFFSTSNINYFALKLSSDGSQIVYSRILGNGTGITQQTQNASKGANIAINDFGDAYVFAHITSTANYTITTNAFQQTPGGAIDAVFTKISPTGNIVYSSYVGGSGNDMAGNITYSNGRIYCIGTTSSSDLPLLTGKPPDAADCYLLSFIDGPIPTFVKSYVFGSDGNDEGLSVSYDKYQQRVCFTGKAANNTIKPTAYLQGDRFGGFVGTIDDNFNFIQFLTIIGVGVVPTGCVARTNGSVYVAGYVSGQLPVSSNAFQSTNKGGLDGMMIAVDITGNFLRYGTYIGGTSSDYAVANVKLLEDRECSLGILFGITTHSGNYPSTRDSYQPDKLNGGDDQPALAMFTIPKQKDILFHGQHQCGEDTFKLVFPCLQPDEVTWLFSDGSQPVINKFQVKHKFPKNGTYTTVARIIYPGPDTVYQSIETIVSSYPKVQTSPNPIYMCESEKSTVLNASGGVKYYWSPGKDMSDSTSQRPTVFPKERINWYYVRGVDSAGCESFDSVQVYRLKALLTVDKDTIICKGQSVKLHASGGASITWLPNKSLNKGTGTEVIASPTVTTTYKVMLMDGACFDTAYITVRVANKPKLQVSPTATMCIGGSADLTALAVSDSAWDTTGLVYQWFDKTSSISNLPTVHVQPTSTTWYRVTVKNAYGCEVTDSVLVKVQNTLQLSISKDTAVCKGGSVQLRVSGASVYRWSPSVGLDDSTSATPRCTPLAKTTYTVIGSGGLCADTQHVTIDVHSVDVQAKGDTSVCQNEVVTLSVVNPDSTVQYTWYPQADFQNSVGTVVYAKPQRSTAYVVTAQSTFGCVATDTVFVQTDNALNVRVEADTSVCSGEVVVFRIVSMHEQGTLFTWFPNNGVFNSTTLEYSVVATNNITYKVNALLGMCQGNDSASVEIKPQPQFSLKADSAVCRNGIATISCISNQTGIQYFWLRDNKADSLLTIIDSTKVATKPLTQPTWFTVVASLNGCTSADSILVTVRDSLTIAPTAEQQVCKGDVVDVQIIGTNLKSVTWVPGNDVQNVGNNKVRITVLNETVYTITAIDSNGCTAATQYATHIKPQNNITFSVSSANVYAGDTLSIYVHAQSERDVTTSLNFDVVYNTTIFKSDSPSSQIGDKSYTHVYMPAVRLTPTVSIVSSIHGQTFLSTPLYSNVSIENIEFDGIECLDSSTGTGYIGVDACFAAGSGIKLYQSLQASIHPNPVQDNIHLTIQTEELSSITITIVDILGNTVYTKQISSKQQTESYLLDATQFPSGVYRLILSDTMQTATLPFVKQ